MNPVMIVHKETGKIWRATSGKVGWKEPSHAKNAWANSFTPCIPKHLMIEHGNYGYTQPIKFNDQDEYEIIFIDEALKELYEFRRVRDQIVEENLLYSEED